MKLTDISIIVLPVSGTLLGLVYAAFIYWLQGGFSRFSFNNEIFEDVLVSDVKVLLDLLVGAGSISLILLFGYPNLATPAYWIFSILFFQDILLAASSYGYLSTVFSKKYIPEKYGVFRRFLRKIKNSGPLRWLQSSVLLISVIIFPYIYGDSSFLEISNKSFEYYLFSANIIAFLQIKSLLVEAYAMRKKMNERLQDKDYELILQNKETDLNWSLEKKKLEQGILNYVFQSINIVPDYEVENLKTIMWDSLTLRKPVLISYPQIAASGSIHVNIIIPFFESDSEYRKYIFLTSRRIFKNIEVSKSDIKHITLSYFNKKSGGGTEHLSMIRSSLSNIKLISSLNLTDEEYIAKLNGTFFAEKIAKF
ncbi:hypothetical protein [Leptospira interrogans]|uniref:Uncharacterized protein n=1 Tax=Leptospira interrogans str. UI 12758 TaxID=1049938 RepID=A0A0E2D3K5_LEPIR|nr:hypothetical protein [Leptospira interrogans]EKR54599.1 hypothetical protein LEP1GSC105_0092 [Leptospira interrogans str. UI 12758]